MSEDRSIAGQLLWWAERVRCMCLIQIYCIFHVKKSKCSVAINHITNTHTHTRYCGGKKTRVSGKENDIWGLLHRPTLWNNDKYCYKSVSACNDKADKDISYSCTYVSMHMPVQNKIISKILNTKDKKYSFQHQSCRPHKSSYISWDIHTHTQKLVTESDSSFRCLRHWPVLLKCICFYTSLLFKGGKKRYNLQILKCNIIHRVAETYSGTGEKPISKLPW